MRLFPILLLFGLATGSLWGTPADLFHYDASAPLDVHEVGVETRGAVTVRDITFVGVKDPIKAYLVAPAQPGPHAAILYVHWLGEPTTTNRRSSFFSCAARKTSSSCRRTWSETGSKSIVWKTR